MSNLSIVVIEGNISAGKTTLSKLIKEKKYKNVVVVEETITDWLDISIDDKNILELFYEDPKRWAFTLQILTLISRLCTVKRIYKEHCKVSDEPLTIITDRYIGADENVFAKLHYDKKNISEIEWVLYNQLKEPYKTDFPEIFDYKIFYMKTEPETCYNRMLNRGNSYENTIPLDYLEELNNYYEEWLNNFNEENILTYDANKDFLRNMDIKNELLETFSNFANIEC